MKDSNIITIVGIDPALRNTGLAAAHYNVETGDWRVERVSLVQTENRAGKTVRKSSDDLRCAKEMLRAINRFVQDHKAVFAVAEVPTGTQSARGAFSNGVCCGVLAGVGVPLIEVSPTEVKLASVGAKTASKDQIIEWAVGRWPEAGWLTRKFKGEVKLIADNEHMADACAAVAAGIQTAQFETALAWKMAHARPAEVESA